MKKLKLSLDPVNERADNGVVKKSTQIYSGC